MSLEEFLRQNTKSEESIRREQKDKQQEEVQYMAQVFVKAFIMACKGSASQGNRKMSFGIPFHVGKQVRGHNYANNESYISICYTQAKHKDIFLEHGFFSPCRLQYFNSENKSASIHGEYVYPKSYADSLAIAIKKELEKNNFAHAKVIYSAATYTKVGQKYFFMAIKTEW